MRTIIDLPEEQVQALKALAEKTRVSRAELVRRAVSEYLDRRRVDAEDDDAFGLWRARGQDGLAYQEARRTEWDR
jgi:metal-responsive CopG/Arc/MetJ family transcriptional regulator